MITGVINDEIFDGKVFYMYGKTGPHVLDWINDLEREHKYDLSSLRSAALDKFCYGACYNMDNGVAVLWALNDTNLVHEILHAASGILKDRGIPFAESTEECYAYYVSFIYERIMTKKKNTKVVKTIDPKTPKNNQGVKPNSKGGSTTGSNDNSKSSENC